MSKKPSTSDLLIGMILDDKYKLERHIGRGGMGSVYIAHHTKFNKQVAVKVLSRDMTEDPTCYERFKREADASARIKHPNAVSVIDFGQTSDDIVYLVMEYVDGLTLRKLLEREKRLAPERTVSLARQICAGIGAAHRASIVHRDLKPDNVMVEIIDGQEVVKVLDFGIAKLKDTQQQNQITKTDSILGTPHYMSPEQCSGGTIDYLSDIYSLGIILYEMLAGHVPFQATSAPAVIVQHVTKDPVPLKKLCPDVPEPLSHVVMRALDKQPSRRQQSALDLANQLEAALTISGLPNNTLIKSASEPTQWRVVFQGVLDVSESGQKRLLEGLQRSFGLSESSAQELLKGRKLSVKKTSSQQEAIKIAEKLRAIGADVKIESIIEKTETNSNNQTIAYQQEQANPNNSDKTLGAQSVDKSNVVTKVDIACDPLLVTDGSEMLSYATEQYAKSKATSLEAKIIQKDINKTSTQPEGKPTNTNNEITQYQTSKLAPKVWQIDVNGIIYENQTPEEVEALIRAGRIRHTHKARLGNAPWQDIGTVPEFRQIIEQINPNAFEPLTAMQEQAKKEENEHASRVFVKRMVEFSIAVLIIYIVVTFTMQYSQRRLLEDDLRVALGDSNTTVKTLRSRTQIAVEQRGLQIPKENIHITVDPPNHQVIVRIDYQRTILGIPLHYQAKRGIGNFSLPINELASLPEGELDIIGLAPGEIEHYRREQATKKAAEKLASYEGESATIKERNEIRKEIGQFESALQLFNVTSVDDKGNQSYSKYIKINEQEYNKEQAENNLSQLKTKLTDLENTLYQQRANKKIELESQIEKSSSKPQ